MTTLHGTDITLVGSDPSYTETVAFCIDQSDGVTAVSNSLKADTCALLGITREITVIPNFLDGARFARAAACRDVPGGQAAHRAHLQLQAGETHRRGGGRLRARARSRCPRRSCWWGGARARAGASAAARAGLDADVEYAGERLDIVDVLSAGRCVPAAVGDRELRPGRARGHGLRGAGRGLARRRPARGDRRRRHRFLHAPDDIDGMAASIMRLVGDPALHARIAAAARRSPSIGSPRRGSCRCTKPRMRRCPAVQSSQ